MTKAPNYGVRKVYERLSPQKTSLAAKDATMLARYAELRDKPKLTTAEKSELQEVGKSFAALLTVDDGLLPSCFADPHLRESTDRLHDELAEQFGAETPLKRTLIDRLVSAWSMSYSYELMFQQMKYRHTEDNKVSIDYSSEKVQFLKEVRKGIESANNQIIRLSETLRNLTLPPIQVKAKNAFFAHNQQINQSVPPKDLEDSPPSHYVTELPHRADTKAAHS